ncbi:MAG: relaxase/mobilization nuclease domain-containing protein, partial [Bulleidia sp.]|nr:relaxase/mobilization nuclease domain-containing protein [Bulleidia sp.]
GKDDGVLAFHAVQSFKPDEITPDECHEIGVRLADQMWGDRFEVVVSTHLDRHHLHNHFVINSVSFMDGKKFDNNRKDYMQFRNLSDELCTVSWWLSCQSQKRNRPITKCRIKKYWHKKSFCFENHLYSCGKLQEIISCGFSLCFT